MNAADARQFKIKVLHPGSGKLTAINLLRAADKIHDAYSAANLRETERITTDGITV